jgi:hypothetical protein
VFRGSPVATEERAGYGTACCVGCQEEQSPILHRPEDLVEEGPVEVGDPLLAIQRGEIESVHQGGVFGEERVSCEV